MRELRIFVRLLSYSSNKCVSILIPSCSICTSTLTKGNSSSIASSKIGSRLRFSNSCLRRSYRQNVATASSAAYRVAIATSTLAKVCFLSTISSKPIILWLNHCSICLSSPTGLPLSKSHANTIVSIIAFLGFRAKLWYTSAISNLRLCPMSVWAKSLWSARVASCILIWFCTPR